MTREPNLGVSAAAVVEDLMLPPNVWFSPKAAAFLAKCPDGTTKRRAFYLRRKLARIDVRREVDVQIGRAQAFAEGHRVRKNKSALVSKVRHNASRARPVCWGKSEGAFAEGAGAESATDDSGSAL